MNTHVIYRQRWRPAAWLVMCLVLVLASLGSYGRVDAEGPGTGGSRIFVADKTVGPYVLLVWAGPSPAQVGRYTVYARVNDAATGRQLREGIEVRVQSTEESTGAVTQAAATHSNAGNSLDYAAHFELARQGNYTYVVTVDGAAGQASVDFRDRVVPTITFGLISAIAGPFIVVIGAVVWFMLARRAERGRREEGVRSRE
jgi:hypothetical protein